MAIDCYVIESVIRLILAVWWACNDAVNIEYYDQDFR